MQALFTRLKGVGTLFPIVVLIDCVVHFVNLRLSDTKI